MRKGRIAPLHVCVVRKVRSDRTRDLFAADKLQMQHHLRGARQKHFVVRNEQHGLADRTDERFEPFERREVEIVAGFVQQQHVAVVEKQRAERKLDALAAGQCAHRLIGMCKCERQPDGLHCERQRSRLECFAVCVKVFDDRKRLFRRRQFLRQIPDRSVDERVALDGRIVLDERRVIQPFQKRRLAVALFADQRGFPPVRHRKRKIFHDRLVVAVDRYGDISCLYHNSSTPLCSDRCALCRGSRVFARPIPIAPFFVSKTKRRSAAEYAGNDPKNRNDCGGRRRRSVFFRQRRTHPIASGLSASFEKPDQLRIRSFAS